MNYLEKSQQIKQEISGDSRLLDIARNSFNEQIEPFSFGGTVNLYAIGQIPSGLYVALRSLRTDMAEGKGTLEQQMRLMEYYCQNAENLDASRQLVPRFCIGVVYGNRAGIFTEDLSNAGTQTVEHHPDNDSALVGSDKRKVYVDIDWLFRATPGLEIKYFLDKNLIRI